MGTQRIRTRPQNALLSARKTDNLILIEAPGKMAALSRILKKARLSDFHILATQGHMMDYPHGLKTLGINVDLKESGRVVVRQEIAKTIAQWAQLTRRVIIATDDDQEGDVIADDLAVQLLSQHPRVIRVRLRSLDEQGVLEAFRQPGALDPSAAWPGRARRITDRLIGAACSGESAHGIKLSAGRVQTALLGVLSRIKLPKAVCHLVLPSASGGFFEARIGITKESHDCAMKLVEQNMAYLSSRPTPIPVGHTQPAPQLQPWAFAPGVLATAKATGRSIEQVAASFQRLYELGRLSYPRSSSAALSPSSIARVKEMAERNGIRVDTSRLGARDGLGAMGAMGAMGPGDFKGARHAHEALCPLDTHVALRTPLELLPEDEAVLSVLARHLISCSQPHLLHKPSPQSLPSWVNQGFTEMASSGGLLTAAVPDFRQVRPIWPQAWPDGQRSMPTPRISPIPVDQQLLAIMASHGLGRPSTQVSHCTSFLQKGLLNEDRELTEKGRLWVQASPEVLLGENFCRRVDEQVVLCGLRPDAMQSATATATDTGQRVSTGQYAAAVGQPSNPPVLAPVLLKAEQEHYPAGTPEEVVRGLLKEANLWDRVAPLLEEGISPRTRSSALPSLA